jgi:3-hydroxyisobutyrate dehydrogenase-like beta-hydroxyacid dehydrogenase
VNVGIAGLGNMGSALAENLVRSGHHVIGHDLAGSKGLPAGATFAASVEQLARTTSVVVFSLPDGAACNVAARGIVASPGRMVSHVVDTSTIGVEAAVALAAVLRAAGIAHIDAPVSGGVRGARARTLAVMYSGSSRACEQVKPVLAGLSDRRFRVGERPGMAQALKLLNNFLSATALVATSEAIAFGTAVGLNMNTMLEVLNGSSGRNSATSDKFPNDVLTGKFASGFASGLMAKDARLYQQAVSARGTPDVLAKVTAAVWQRFADAEPDADFTRIYPFVESQSV